MKYLFWDNIKNHSWPGSKAITLSKLKKNGFLVPNFFVIQNKKKYFTEIEKNKIIKELSKLKTKKISIRSSANVEDSSILSWAGQFKTFLNIDKKNHNKILQKIKDVHDSVKSKNVLNYKKNNNIKKDIKINIIIQEMIEAEKSGVAFSINPISKNNNEIIINASYGTGDKVVGGKITPDEYIILKDNLNFNNTKFNILKKKEILNLVKNIKHIENFFNFPVDIEWSILNNKIYILQSRPITINKQLNIFDNSNISESYAGTTSPLSFSFAKEAYREVYKEFAILMGTSQKEIEKNSDIFENMIEYIGHHFYYNLINWYRLISLFPAYSVSKDLMENMMGVSKSFRNKITIIKPKNRFVSFFKSTTKFFRIFYTFSKLEKDMKKFNSFFDEYYEKELKKNLSNYSINELKKRYRKIEKDLIKNWRIPIANDFAVMISVGLSEKKYKKWVNKNNFFNFITSKNKKDFISTKPGNDLMDIIKLSKNNKIDFSKNIDNKIILKNLKKINNPLSKKFFKYIKIYSIRIPNELKLESITLDDDPKILIQMIKNYSITNDNKEQIKEEPKIDDLKLSLIKKTILNFLFNWSKKSISRREESRFRRGQAFNLIRKIFLEAGKKYTLEKKINNHRDIFFLTVDEIFYSSKDFNFKKIISKRKKESFNFSKTQLDKRFEFYLSPNEINNYIKNNLSKNTPQKETSFKGKTTSEGNSTITKGEVIIMKKFDPTINIQNKILITKHTDPGWTPIFPLLKGIIIENGGMLSHASIVAREFKIPCITGINNATLKLKNNDIVEINTSTETIRIIK